MSKKELVLLDFDVLKELLRSMIEEAISKAETSNKGSNDSDIILDRREAAALLGISLPTLSKHTKEGILPAYRLGSNVRYKRSELIDSLSKIRIRK